MVLHVCGGDKRMEYLKDMLLEDGHSLTECPKDADAVILPMPLSANGIHISETEIELEKFLDLVPPNVPALAGGANQRVVDYSKDEGLATLNAIPTAEGAIALAKGMSHRTIHGSRCLVVGCGRIGKYLGTLLKAMGAEVTLSARSDKDFAWCEAYGFKSVKTDNLRDSIAEADFIFSTVPAKVVLLPQLEMVKKDAVLVELASKPYGIDFEEARSLNLNAVLAAGLPGKMAPYTAAQVIKNTIYRLLEGIQIEK